MEFIFLLRGRETIAEHLGSKEHFGERGVLIGLEILQDRKEEPQILWNLNKYL